MGHVKKSWNYFRFILGCSTWVTDITGRKDPTTEGTWKHQMREVRKQWCQYGGTTVNSYFLKYAYMYVYVHMYFCRFASTVWMTWVLSKGVDMRSPCLRSCPRGCEYQAPGDKDGWKPQRNFLQFSVGVFIDIYAGVCVDTWIYFLSLSAERIRKQIHLRRIKHTNHPDFGQ